MVRFARSGGEANAIAIRIARAASGRDKVAICGYHGWHDWYLAANLGDEQNLAGHLLPGLEPNGVPQDLRGSVLPFRYNNFAELEELVRTHDIGVIKMEVSRNMGPEPGFLQSVRQLASDKGIVLIFDECTSGFRQTFGGLHKLYGVEPDMAMFGKALGNGYAITATIGRREVMEAAQRTFISSTFWTERIGPTAALKTLEVMERLRSWEQITATGRDIAAGWQALARKHGLAIAISGLPALTGFSFDSPRALEYKTLITQEMLAKGYLASTSVYVCTEHSPQIVAGYLRGARSGLRAHQRMRAGQGCHEPAQGSGLPQRLQAVELMMHSPVLVLAAHPDDEVLGCGGTIARLAAEGAAVHVAFFADGVSSRAAGPGAPAQDAELAARRAAAQRACDVLGVASVTFGDLPDNRLDTIALLEVVKRVEALIARHHPDTVFTHHAGDLNVDHRRIHEATVVAARPQRGNPVKALLSFEVPSSTEWQLPGSGAAFTPNWFVDISAFLPRKLEALQAYASELRSWPHPRSREAIEYLARWRGATVGVDAAEAFILGRHLS